MNMASNPKAKEPIRNIIYRISMASMLIPNRARGNDNLKAEKRRMEKILNRLSSEFKPWRRDTNDPFLLLVGVVLSQNTNDRNSFAAYDRLVSKFKTPEQIANARAVEIRKLIRVGGLYKEKSMRLKEISRAVLEKYKGDLNQVLKMPLEGARKELLSLPGVGPKTADVVLAFGARRDIFPVDTHVFRVSRRLGFANAKDGYENVREKLEAVTQAGRNTEGHMLLIQLGRRYCRARKPIHLECPVKLFCPIGARYSRRRHSKTSRTENA